MLVKDLIAELQKYPPETLVTIASYEFGFEVLTKVQAVKLSALPQTSAMSATHVFADPTDGGSMAVAAVCLGDLEPSLSNARETCELPSSA